MPFTKGHPFYPGTKNLFKKGQKPINFIGKIKRGNYWYIFEPDHPFSGKQGYIAEHRLVMEKKIGRYITPQEAIHHINNIPTDNRIENLELCESHGQHTIKYHSNLFQKQRIAFKGKH